jgi:hypothetical protein
MLIPSRLAELDYVPEVKRISDTLLAPLDPNHIRVTTQDAQHFADRLRVSAAAYEFDDASVAAVLALMAIHRRRCHVMERCRAPHPKAFFEFPAPKGRIGIYTEGDRDDFHLTALLLHADLGLLDVPLT